MPAAVLGDAPETTGRRADSVSPWIWACAVTWLADLFLHKTLSQLCDRAAAVLGFAAYDGIALGSTIVLMVAATGYVALRANTYPRSTRICGIIVLLALVAAQRRLLVANVELIHLPQYALIAGMLLRSGLSPQAAWLAAAALGMADEVYQYVVVYANYADVYLDGNDMVLNALGAACGVVLCSHWSQSAVEGPPMRRPQALWVALVGLSLLGMAVWSNSAPFLRRAATKRDYHVLSPLETLGVGVCLYAVVLVVDTARRGRSGRTRARHGATAASAMATADIERRFPVEPLAGADSRDASCQPVGKL